MSCLVFSFIVRSFYYYSVWLFSCIFGFSSFLFFCFVFRDLRLEFFFSDVVEGTGLGFFLE